MTLKELVKDFSRAIWNLRIVLGAYLGGIFVGASGNGWGFFVVGLGLYLWALFMWCKLEYELQKATDDLKRFLEKLQDADRRKL